MKLQRNISPMVTLAKILFLALPTIAVIYFLLYNVNQYFSILRAQQLTQTIYVGLGLCAGILFYAWRFRFSTTMLLLISIFYVGYKGLDQYAIGEFDAFFISIQFLVFGLLFSIGWLFGFLFQRFKYAHICIASLLLLASIYVIARTGGFNFQQFIFLFGPILLYSFYIIYTTEALKQVQETNGKFWMSFIGRLLAFIIGTVALIFLLFALFKVDIKAKIIEVKRNATEGKNNQNAVSRKDKDGNTTMNDAMSMSAKNSRSKELMFCAHINNFFEGTDIPNPLYLTSYHYSKFDTLSETFERDRIIPSNDEFTPDVAKIPMYATLTDSTKIKNSLSTKMRKDVDIEIYNHSLSPSLFLAPSTSYFVQPISIEKNYQKIFKTAFRAKSKVSKLNSAFFIVNSDNPIIKNFQEERFTELRKAKNYATVDSTFLKYYTHMPSNPQYKKLVDLAHEIDTKNKYTIDKIIAVRDYYLQRNALGEKLFKYSDNPGIPGMPSASKIMHFMFETRKGYCAYYAGSTFLLLRAMHIPCRIAVGFISFDRSNKNKGWYWYYGDQAHAWVEVYFPEYGWIDFDTTIGNDEAQMASKADGTPPNQPSKANFVANGIVVDNDTLKKILQLQVKNIVVKDKNFTVSNKLITLDTKIASVVKDTLQLLLSNVKKGDDVTCISYAEALKNLDGTNATDVLNKVKMPCPIDEIRINEIAKKEAKQKTIVEKNTDWSTGKILGFIVGLALLLISLLLLIPTFVYNYYKTKVKNAKSNKSKAYYLYTLHNFYLHQLGIKRADKTPLQFAEKIDSQYQTQYVKFMQVYLKYKYSDTPTTTNEQQTVNDFDILPTIKNSTAPKERVKKFINPIRTIEFLIQHK